MYTPLPMFDLCLRSDGIILALRWTAIQFILRQSCVCVPCFLWKSALLLSLNLLSFLFFMISPFAVSCTTICEKSFSCSSFFEMAVLFFYSAFVCRLLFITIFLPSLQYLFSVFCRRKSGHLPELP